jgi:hypothetical protein
MQLETGPFPFRPTVEVPRSRVEAQQPKKIESKPEPPVTLETVMLGIKERMPHYADMIQQARLDEQALHELDELLVEWGKDIVAAKEVGKLAQVDQINKRNENAVMDIVIAAGKRAGKMAAA